MRYLRIIEDKDTVTAVWIKETSIFYNGGNEFLKKYLKQCSENGVETPMKHDHLKQQTPELLQITDQLFLEALCEVLEYYAYLAEIHETATDNTLREVVRDATLTTKEKEMIENKLEKLSKLEKSFLIKYLPTKNN